MALQRKLWKGNQENDDAFSNHNFDFLNKSVLKYTLKLYASSKLAKYKNM